MSKASLPTSAHSRNKLRSSPGNQPNAQASKPARVFLSVRESKLETRNSKFEAKSNSQNSKRPSLSNFEFWGCFEFRISSFEFHFPIKCCCLWSNKCPAFDNIRKENTVAKPRYFS